MVTVIFKPPAELPKNFRHKAHSSIRVIEDWETEYDEDMFAFKRGIGELCAILRAFESIPCTCKVTLRIEHEEWAATGEIVVWKDPLSVLAEEALEDFLTEARWLRDRCFGCRVEIDYELTRTLESGS